jgi:hypothetical protein
MEHEPGDEYLRRLSVFIRSNEKSLAEAGFTRRRRAPRRAAPDPVSAFNPLGWFGLESSTQSPSPPPKPIILSLDIHHLFYVLMRLEALGIDIGTLDVQVDNPSRPMSYINLFPDADKSETLSLASFRSSFSAVSGLSLGAGWWGRAEPPTVDAELKYIYSSFTKLPALSVNAPGRKIITELTNDPPNENALPLDAFKNLQSLECLDIDPRSLLGWDRLAESLRSLKIKKSGLEDVSDIFIGAVVDDQARREGSTSRKRRRRIPRGPTREISFYTTRLPDSVPEDADEENVNSSSPTAPSPPPSTQLSSLKWAFLKHLSLSDNSLTFFPSESIPYLTSLTHLDLSSNLLVSVPSGLGSLYNLVSLNLADNMIDSVLGIYLNLGQVLSLNLSHNRLESICGLERLHALERVDLRNNLMDESAEVGRLAPLPNIAEVWVEGNPFVEIEEGYRITCFDYFWKEGKSITLDGTSPGFYEKRNLTIPPPQQMSSSRPLSTAYSPPVVAVGHSHPHPSPSSNAVDKKPTPPTSSASPHLAPVGVVGVGGRARRKKNKRIVDLDGEHSDGSSRSASHTRMRSDESTRTRARVKVKKLREGGGSPQPSQPVSVSKAWGQFGALIKDEIVTPEAHVVLTDTPITLPVDTNQAPTADPEPLAKPSPPITPLRTSTNASTLAHSPHRSRHSRYQTEFLYVPSPNFNTPDILSFSPTNSNVNPTTPAPTQSTSGTAATAAEASPTSPVAVTPPFRRGSATLSSKLAARRTRVSASVYEPPTSISDGEDNSGADGGGGEIRDNADAYRKRIEALRKDMGDGWLKVFSQSQMKSPS